MYHVHYCFFLCSLTEKFFEMPKKQAKEALDLYKKFLIRMERCAETLKVAEVCTKLYGCVTRKSVFIFLYFALV